MERIGMDDLPESIQLPDILPMVLCTEGAPLRRFSTFPSASLTTTFDIQSLLFITEGRLVGRMRT
jgi:hypothetical protein